MDDKEALSAFALDLQQEVIGRAEREGNEQLREDPFTEILIEYLSEAGEFDDGVVCQHRSHGVQVNGYGISEDEECLDLFVSHCTQTLPPETVQKRDIETLFKRLQGFLEKSMDGYAQQMEEASPAFDLAQRISELKESLSRVRLFLFTDGLSKMEEIPNVSLEGIEISHHVWDLRRLFRCIHSGTRRETIEIDFMSLFGHPIPCLEVSPPGSEYACYLASFSGPVLVELYSRFGPRLLERNVRCFLQARGNINKGIRTTILEEPQMFLAYNNGLSATAEKVEVVTHKDGSKGIGSVRDFQIVNGGQTTGSIYHAHRKDSADVSLIRIPMKLTVLLQKERVEIVAPRISEYANSQNKVNTADFSANDPFHVAIEEKSRTTWAPAPDGIQKQTRWYYERARGQYQDDKARNKTIAQRKQFDAMHPSSQMFTKTDLAKFENTWALLPHVVSRGAQKNFIDFTLRLKERGAIEVDDKYFQRLVAKGLFFRQAERVIHSQQFGGYRANIVAYTVSWLSRKTAQRIDLDRIWKEQRLTAALEDAIRSVAVKVHGHITQPPSSGNVTEWCKKEECWKKLCDLDVPLPGALSEELISVDRSTEIRLNQGIDAPSKAEIETIQELATVTADSWFKLSKWAKETGNLQAWQRSLAYSLGRLATNGKKPSRKQATQGKKILDEAKRLGFSVEVRA